MGFPSELKHSPEQPFQPCQIVCLEHGSSRLYAEVIQIVEARQICWVRPLILAVGMAIDSCEKNNIENQCCYDLRCGADLLYPLMLFRVALDTEMVPLLSFLYTDHHADEQDTHHQLKHFIQKVWQAYPEMFCLKSEEGYGLGTS